MSDGSVRSLFVNQLSAISSEVLAAYRETVAYWDPDEPPDTVLLADLGRRIVEEFPSVDDAVNDRLLFEIERAMASDDELLATVVTTRMIEAMAGTAKAWADGTTSGRNLERCLWTMLIGGTDRADAWSHDRW